MYPTYSGHELIIVTLDSIFKIIKLSYVHVIVIDCSLMCNCDIIITTFNAVNVYVIVLGNIKINNYNHCIRLHLNVTGSMSATQGENALYSVSTEYLVHVYLLWNERVVLSTVL